MILGLLARRLYSSGAALVRRIRSSKWRAVEKRWLRNNPRCAACGTTKRLQVHHVEPFHLRPELELDESNLITLCMGPLEDHLHVGHHGKWKDSNPRVRQDAAMHLMIRGDP